jgi:hypothetical protein
MLTFLLCLALAFGVFFFLPCHLEQIDSPCNALDRLLLRNILHGISLGQVDLRKVPKGVKDAGLGFLSALTGFSAADSMLTDFKRKNNLEYAIKDEFGNYHPAANAHCAFVYYSLIIKEEIKKNSKKEEM